jgi:hypothetical protein
VIVEGGSSEDIAKAIYTARSAGCGMKGNISEDITQIDGSIFTINFDRVDLVNIYVKFNVTSSGGIINPNFIKEQLANNIKPDVAGSVDSTQITAAVKEISPNALISGCVVSADGQNWKDIITPADKRTRYVLTAANIKINGE